MKTKTERPFKIARQKYSAKCMLAAFAVGIAIARSIDLLYFNYN
jgi:hypothetical protein